MASRFDEDGRAIKSAAHEIGGDLSAVPLADLDARIAMLREEIARIEAEKARRGGAIRAADALFRPRPD
jgi:uncharacterized small protein (DUF1192 family)